MTAKLPVYEHESDSSEGGAVLPWSEVAQDLGLCVVCYSWSDCGC